MYKIFCDVCENEISNTETEGGVFNFYRIETPVDFKSGEMGTPVPKNYKYDCCGKCSGKILEFIESTKKIKK